MPFDNPQESGKPVAIKDEGLTITTSAASLDFVGPGVTATAVGGVVTVTIPGGGSSYTFVKNEVPTGTIDGINKVFTWAHTPATGVIVSLNGNTVSPAGNDYTTVGAVTTFVVAPAPNSILVGSYEY